MSVAKVIEITSTSKKSFTDAIENGIKRPRRDARIDAGADQEVSVKNGRVAGGADARHVHVDGEPQRRASGPRRGRGILEPIDAGSGSVVSWYADPRRGAMLDQALDAAEARGA
jgi:flavin-binding protein dodecin